MLKLRAQGDCLFDAVSLGEVMLRLDPGTRRIHTARNFDVWEGGGEYNVARGLRRCFDKRTAIVTALADNAVGRLIEDLILQSGVDARLLKWAPADGAGFDVRNGLNFTERGFGVRGAHGCSDRGNTAASQMRPEEMNFDSLFEKGVRWFHTGGIYAALSDSCAKVALAAASSAKKNETCVSYDLNYRPSLWDGRGGKERARAVNRELVQHVDVLFGNEEDFSASLGFEIKGIDDAFSSLPMKQFKKMIEQVLRAFPHLSTVATTLRTASTASRNLWGAVCFHQGEFFEVPQREIEILDRVGGGDSFASGFIHGLLEARGAQYALECGVAHGALAMTTPGDTSMVRLDEVEALMSGTGTRISR